MTTPLTTPRQRLQLEVQKALHLLFEQQAWSGDVPTVGLEPAKKVEHGDFACTIALALAKRVSQPPRQIADLLLVALGDAGGLLAKVEVAGPGFFKFISRTRSVAPGIGRYLTARSDVFSQSVWGGA